MLAHDAVERVQCEADHLLGSLALSMKLKKMPLEEFAEVRQRDGLPVQLVAHAIPSWLHSVPDEILDCVHASGTLNVPHNAAYRSTLIPSGDLIGGIDVYRRAPNDPVALNKDWYAVVTCKNEPTMLFVDGPFKDAEHWLDQIPRRLLRVEVLGIPKLRKDEKA
jgi:hypothetical protein